MQKIKKGDEVIITVGKDKGRRGVVLAVLMKGKKLLIEGINTVKKHEKADPNNKKEGGIIIVSHPIDGSNAMYYDQASERGKRVKIRIREDGRRVRYILSNNEKVDIDV